MINKYVLNVYRRLFNPIYDRDLKNVITLINKVSDIDINRFTKKKVRTSCIRSSFDNLGQWGESIENMESILYSEQLVNDGFYKNMDNKVIYLDDWLIRDGIRVDIKKATVIIRKKITQLIYNINNYYFYNIDYYRYYKRLNMPHYHIIKQWTDIITNKDY